MDQTYKYFLCVYNKDKNVENKVLTSLLKMEYN